MLTLANKILSVDLFGSIDRTIRIIKLSNDVNGIMLSLILLQMYKKSNKSNKIYKISRSINQSSTNTRI